MKKFKVLIKGNDYKTAVGSRVQTFGFHTTRFIESDSDDSAKERALKLVKRQLEDIVFNNPAGSPVVEALQFVEVESFGDNEVPGSGFTWHMEGKSERV